MQLAGKWRGQVSGAPLNASLTPRRLHPAAPARKGLGCQGSRSAASYGAAPRLPEVSGWLPAVSVHGCGQWKPRRVLAKDNTHHLLAVPSSLPCMGVWIATVLDREYLENPKSSLRGKHRNFKRGLMLPVKHKHNSLLLREVKYLHWENFKTIVSCRFEGWRRSII